MTSKRPRTLLPVTPRKRVSTTRRVWPLWHPSVHDEYGEHLYFLGLVVDEYPKALKLLRNPETLPHPMSIYEVFGDRDMIVRLRATKRQYDAVVQFLEAQVGHVASVFAVEDVCCISGYTLPDPLKDHRLPSILHSLSQFPSAELRRLAPEWNKVSPEQKAALSTANLIIGEASEGSRPSIIRAFIIVGSTLSRMNTIHDIVGTIQSKVPRIRKYLTGLYVGKATGFGAGDILLELGVPNRDFAYIIKIIRQIHGALELIFPRTKTYLAGDTMCEHIDRCGFEETPEQAIERWIERFPLLRSLELMDQLSVIHLCQRWSRWLSFNPIRSIAEAVIVGIIQQRRATDDTGTRHLKLTILQTGELIESLLQKLLYRRASTRWNDAERDEQVRKTLGLAKPVKGLTLGEVLDVCRRWRAQFSEDVIAATTVARLQEFVELRNAAVHPDRRKEGARRFEDYTETMMLAILDEAFAVVRDTAIESREKQAQTEA